MNFTKHTEGFSKPQLYVDGILCIYHTYLILHKYMQMKQFQTLTFSMLNFVIGTFPWKAYHLSTAMSSCNR